MILYVGLYQDVVYNVYFKLPYFIYSFITELSFFANFLKNEKVNIFL